jgi:hypothetical protein
LKVFESDNALDAWRAVSTYLLAVNGRSEPNLLISMANLPTPAQDAEWLRQYDPQSVTRGADLSRDVANTIFPLKTWENASDRPAFYQRYARAARLGQRRNPTRWGTYFGRLTSSGATHVNQLERVVDSLERWETNHRAALTMHLSSAETDSPRTRGGPCLQYIQVACPKATSVALVAVYRSHDYFNKALGNFIGLGRLLRFIADETGREPAGLVCHSIHAFFSGSDAQMRALLAR